MSVHTLAEHVRLRSRAAYQETLAQVGQTTEAITVVAGELERQEWELVKGKIEYDRQILKAYLRRCSDKEAMNYHANREHHHRRHKSALVAAHKFVEMNTCMIGAAHAHECTRVRHAPSDIVAAPTCSSAALSCASTTPY